MLLDAPTHDALVTLALALALAPALTLTRRGYTTFWRTTPDPRCSAWSLLAALGVAPRRYRGDLRRSECVSFPTRCGRSCGTFILLENPLMKMEKEISRGCAPDPPLLHPSLDEHARRSGPPAATQRALPSSARRQQDLPQQAYLSVYLSVVSK